jgi:hypothetical protein
VSGGIKRFRRSYLSCVSAPIFCVTVAERYHRDHRQPKACASLLNRQSDHADGNALPLLEIARETGRRSVVSGEE